MTLEHELRVIRSQWRVVAEIERANAKNTEKTEQGARRHARATARAEAYDRCADVLEKLITSAA